MTILLTGGTGKTALPIAQRLHNAGHSVLLASRSGTAPAPFGGVVFNWMDPSTFTKPFDMDDAIDRVYLVCPLAHDMLEVVKPFIELAISKGVKRFVLLSSTLQDRGSPAMGKVHEYIEDRGIEWAVLRPTWFIENFSTFYLKSIRDDNWIPTSMGDGKVPYIAVDDIAQVAYQALTDEKSHNTDHIIVGPHAYTHDEIATILSQILGRKIEHSRLSGRDAVRFWVESLGFPEAVVPAMIAIEHRTAQGSEYDSFIKPIVGKVVGKVRLEDFIRANRELWVPQAKN